jgi:hypothetical protein
LAAVSDTDAIVLREIGPPWRVGTARVAAPDRFLTDVSQAGIGHEIRASCSPGERLTKIDTFAVREAARFGDPAVTCARLEDV